MPRVVKLGINRPATKPLLPDPEPQDEDLVIGTRALGRTTKLYLFKLLGWKDRGLGLHRASFVPGDRLRDQPAQPGEMVHAINGGEARYRDLADGGPHPDQVAVPDATDPTAGERLR